MLKEEIMSVIKAEGDSKEFKYKGYRCEIKRIPHLLHLCGYVYTHMDLPEDVINSLAVHGGITFNEFNSARGTRKIGFDCGHCEDLVPGIPYTHDCVYRNMGYVENEIKHFVDQLTSIEGEETIPDYQKENMQMIGKVLDGIDLSDAEKKTINWITTWETCTVENLASVIKKARSTKEPKGLASLSATLFKKNNAVNGAVIERDIKLFGDTADILGLVQAIVSTLKNHSGIDESCIVDSVAQGLSSEYADLIREIMEILK